MTRQEQDEVVTALKSGIAAGRRRFVDLGPELAEAKPARRLQPDFPTAMS
jgi:hypothetical protein